MPARVEPRAARRRSRGCSSTASPAQFPAPRSRSQSTRRAACWSHATASPTRPRRCTRPRSAGRRRSRCASTRAPARIPRSTATRAYSSTAISMPRCSPRWTSANGAASSRSPFCRGAAELGRGAARAERRATAAAGDGRRRHPRADLRGAMRRARVPLSSAVRRVPARAHARELHPATIARGAARGGFVAATRRRSRSRARSAAAGAAMARRMRS